MVVIEVLLTVQEARRTVLVPTDLGGRQVLAKFFRALGDPTRLCGYVVARPAGRSPYFRVAGPRVAEPVLLARSLAADNTAELADCARIDTDTDLRSTP